MRAILSEKPSRTRRSRPRWILALSAIPLLGVVAAFGIAPDTATERIARKEVLENVALNVAVGAQHGSDQETYWREERIQRGDSIGSLLARLEVDDLVASAYLRGTRDLRALQQLVPGRTVRVMTTGEGRLLSLRYLNQDGTELVVKREGEGFVTQAQAPAGTVQILMTSGQIETSLFAATDTAGLSDGVATQLSEIFSGEVDFHRDLRPGDRFSVVYEGVYANGELVRTGRILAAEFMNRGRAIRAVYFEDAHGQGSYFTPSGRNVRKQFLLSPLEFSRVTSGFSNARLHPVLNVLRAHKGVDYAAPIGTKVRATADGTVEYASVKGGYGKVVVLTHKGQYSTVYGHLSGFAPGVRPGQKVSQGEVIGYVGMSGLATGPHLHYEFLVDGVHHDPLGDAMPAGVSISSGAYQDFRRATGALLERLDLIQGSNVALAY